VTENWRMSETSDFSHWVLVTEYIWYRNMVKERRETNYASPQIFPPFYFLGNFQTIAQGKGNQKNTVVFFGTRV
jgi:hypothetical protein